MAMLAGVVIAGPASPAGAADGAGVLLPNLVELRPGAGPVVDTGTDERLGVTAGVANDGPGPLILTARRAGALMTARQLIRRTGAPPVLGGVVGRLRYTISPDHRHWHLLRFERYELRTTGGRVLGRDHKSGFCLGDRSSAPGIDTTAPREFPGRCGLDEPALKRLREGLSPTWSDTYAAQLEGQYVDVTGVPDGQYWLVARADPDRRIAQTTRVDDVAGVLLRLRPAMGIEPAGRHVDELETCVGAACPAAVRGS